MRIAAIDQGTTSTRALLFADDKAAIVHAVRHAQHYPQAGWVEHDPEELIASILACVAACGPVDAIGIDNQGESCLAWDSESGKALSPVIVWQDNRTAALIETMKVDGTEAMALERAGLPLDAYFSASKLGWLLRNSEPVRQALSVGRLRLGTTDAFFLDRLAGCFATDITTASRTGLMNIATGLWDPDLCALYGVPLECLPEIRPTTGPFGALNGTPITCSVVDQQAALFGHGCRNRGDAKITFGTGAFALAISEDTLVRAAGQGLLPTIAWQTEQGLVRAVDGGVYNAGSAVEWAERIGLFSDFAELDGFEAPPAIERGLAFVPALAGLASPHWDRSAAALWLGMGAETTRRDLVQAVLEGVVLRTAEVIDALHAQVPLGGMISIDGGLTGSAYFCQFLADVLGRAVVTRSDGELTALGTAGLTVLGAGGAPLPAAAIGRTYAPGDVARDGWRERFSEAVSRARSWR